MGIFSFLKKKKKKKPTQKVTIPTKAPERTSVGKALAKGGGGRLTKAPSISKGSGFKTGGGFTKKETADFEKRLAERGELKTEVDPVTGQSFSVNQKTGERTPLGTGGVSEVTAGDILTLTGAGGLAKGAVTGLARATAGIVGKKGAARLIGGAGKFIKPSLRNVIGKSGKVTQANLAKTFPGVSKATIKSVAIKFNKMEADEVIKLLTKKPISVKKIFKVGGAVLAGLLSTDTLTTWFALDNILSGTKFLIPDIQKGLELGTITPEEANEMIDQADEAIRLARSKVDITARYNPLMFPARKLIFSGAVQKETTWNLARDNLREEISIGAPSEGQQIRQASIIRDFEKGFISEDEARNLLQQTSQEAVTSLLEGSQSGGINLSGDETNIERGEAGFAASLQDTPEDSFSRTGRRDLEEPEIEITPQLQLIIDKRDSGQRLTPEEEQLLRDAGLPDRRQQTESFGRSSLGFGI